MRSPNWSKLAKGKGDLRPALASQPAGRQGRLGGQLTPAGAHKDHRQQ